MTSRVELARYVQKNGINCAGAALLWLTRWKYPDIDSLDAVNYNSAYLFQIRQMVVLEWLNRGIMVHTPIMNEKTKPSDFLLNLYKVSKQNNNIIFIGGIIETEPENLIRHMITILSFHNTGKGTKVKILDTGSAKRKACIGVVPLDFLDRRIRKIPDENDTTAVGFIGEKISRHINSPSYERDILTEIDLMESILTHNRELMLANKQDRWSK